jgi:hypothetical protein
MNVKVFTATASEIPRLEANINLWLASIEATGQVSSTNLAVTQVAAQTGGMQPFVIVTVWYGPL